MYKCSAWKYFAALLAFVSALQVSAPVSAHLVTNLRTAYDPPISSIFSDESAVENASDHKNRPDNSPLNENLSDTGALNKNNSGGIPADGHDTDEPHGDDLSGDNFFMYDEPPPFEYEDPPRAGDWSPDLITDITVSSREEGLDIEGTYPEISDDFGGSAGSLNEAIGEAVKNRIRSAKDARAKSISFDYEIFAGSEMISVILRSTVTSATSKTELDSVNFNPSDGSPMDLTDVVGFDIVPLAEKILNERIRRDPEGYNSAFDTSTIAENPFYLEDEQVVILFDDFQLSSAANGVNELRLDLNRTRQVKIARSEYRINRDYNLRMVPLKQICLGLGYDAEWVEEDSRVDVFLKGEIISDLEPGANDYEEPGKRRRPLETAPELHFGTVYVPISFFDQILNRITYTVDGDNNIIFYSYDI